MPANPFVIGQWVRGEKFYGRAPLIGEILEGNRNWLWVLGTRRVGKTSLLKQIEFLTSSAESGWFPVFWDFQGADDPEELHRGFSDALLDAAERLERIGIQPVDVEGANLFESLRNLRRRLRASKLKLLLLCDEVEELIKLSRKDPALLGKLRREMQSQEDVRSVLTSTIRLWQLAAQRGDTSPFLHGFTPPLYIHGLADDEALALIRQTNLRQDLRPVFGDDVVNEIRARCDNHPYLIQLVCKRYLEVRSLEDAVEQVAADQMVSYFFSVDFEMLSQAERHVIRIIAESSSASSDSIVNRFSVEPGELSSILLRLEHLGYIRRNPDRRFELVNYFFRRWFRDQPRSGSSPEPGASRPPADLLVGDRSTQRGEIGPALFDGRYRLIQEVGRGAMGVVFKAHDEVLGETIAVKILKAEYSSDLESLERFRREILLSRDIVHPNILKVYHLGDCQGQKYLAMKLVEGPTLAKLIDASGPLDLGLTVEIGWKLASVLEAAHGQNVIHRDIKPQNVLMDSRSEPYLSDFGLARLINGPGMTQAGVFLGTPNYAAPEQGKLLRADERSDIYSLGVVIYVMATGKRPFVSDSAQTVLEMHWTTPPPDPRLIRPEILPDLSRIILRCLEKEPAQRYQTAHALRLDLAKVRGH